MSNKPETIVAARMDTDIIAAQRPLGWPDFHPEDYCHRCGDRNPRWYCAADVWAVISTQYMGEETHAGIMCPTCAIELYAAATGERGVWVLDPPRGGHHGGLPNDSVPLNPPKRDR